MTSKLFCNPPQHPLAISRLARLISFRAATLLLAGVLFAVVLGILVQRRRTQVK